ncbi:histidine kinase [Chitinophaga niastensis]|uniref:Histidine kinase n=1 Tax=Chitinophaga niastensis TaxID=536980 RepID=A0A2P8HEQ1_CHINA|nr:sensor histidine kinase [Chitinophaga niastensis]PSL44661.1 histidine kinase [Chitinophaga niastensis]
MGKYRQYPPITILVHFIVWTLYASVTLLVYASSSSHPKIVIYETIETFFICAAIFYTNSDFFLPVFFEKKEYVKYTICIIISFLVHLGIRYLFAYYIDPFVMGSPSTVVDMNFTSFTIISTWWWFQATLFSFGYWFSKVSIKREQEVSMVRDEMTIKETEQLKLRQEKLELENAFLRTQINPHFLFNTLGYFYNKVSDTHPDVAEGIVALTNIMRSSISKKTHDGLVSLEEEVENIEYLISIYRMRYNNKVYILFNKAGEYNLRIMPHILITLVENAFKHGDLHDPANPLIICLDIQDKDINFHIHNKKRFGPKEISSGVGLQYVAKHLELMYPGNYHFNIDNKEYLYTVNLHLKTN